MKLGQEQSLFGVDVPLTICILDHFHGWENLISQLGIILGMDTFEMASHLSYMYLFNFR